MSAHKVKDPSSKTQNYIRPLKRKIKEVDDVVDGKECEEGDMEELNLNKDEISSVDTDDEGDDKLDLEVKPVHIKQEGIPFHTDRLPKPPFRMLMVAQSHSGKTTCIMNLITNPKMYKSYFKNRVHIFSRNILNDPAFLCLNEKILSNSWDGYLPHLLENIYNKQKELVEEEGKTKSNAQLIILDDVISDVYSRNKPSILSTMFMMCRHVNISIILTSQQYKLIPKPIRVNCSSLICFRIHNNEEIRNIFNEHGGILSYKQFEKILNYCWQGKYDFMYCELANATPAYRFRRNFSKAKSVMDLLTSHTNDQ